MLTGQGLPKYALQIGNTIFNDVENLLVLTARWDGATSTCGTARKEFDTSGYLVPAGKTLYILAARVVVTGTIPERAITIGYSDNDVGPNTTGAGLTNAKSHDAGRLVSTRSGTDKNEASYFIKIPTGKYPFVSCSAAPGAGIEFQASLFGYLK